MIRNIFILLFLILSVPNILFGDSGPDYSKIEIMQESFSDNFPPPGWTVVSSHINNTWKSVTSAFDGKLTNIFGDYFAFVQGDSTLPSNELLITPRIEIPSECVYFNGNYEIELIMDYYAQVFDETDYKLIIEYSRTAYPEWDIIGYDLIENSSNFLWEFDLYINDPTFSLYPQFIWVGFRFYGTDLIELSGFAIEYITISCEWTYPNGDFEDDEMSDNDNSNPALTDDNDSHHGCGCSMASANTDVSLFLTMFLIGIGAWIIGKMRE